MGCGNGGSTCAVARTGVRGARDRARPVGADDHRGPAPRRGRHVANVTFEQADAQVHPFVPGAFDAVVSKFCVMFFADPLAAFTNLARALRPTARLAVLAWRDLTENEWAHRPREALAAERDLPPLRRACRARSARRRTGSAPCSPMPGSSTCAVEKVDEPFVAGGRRRRSVRVRRGRPASPGGCSTASTRRTRRALGDVARRPGRARPRPGSRWLVGVVGPRPPLLSDGRAVGSRESRSGRPAAARNARDHPRELLGRVGVELGRATAPCGSR